jgi:hypothetical protein
MLEDSTPLELTDVLQCQENLVSSWKARYPNFPDAKLCGFLLSVGGLLMFLLQKREDLSLSYNVGFCALALLQKILSSSSKSEDGSVCWKLKDTFVRLEVSELYIALSVTPLFCTHNNYSFYGNSRTNNQRKKPSLAFCRKDSG